MPRKADFWGSCKPFVPSQWRLKAVSPYSEIMNSTKSVVSFIIAKDDNIGLFMHSE